MSVTIEGIKGYEYQYKVTALIALLRHLEKVELFVEMAGSEDALLKIKQKNIEKTIEIQVKREKNILNIPKLVDWLCHFQENKSDNNLLQRITNNKDSIALFITHSRCSDDTVILKKEIQSINTHDNIPISKKGKKWEKWKDNFITSLKKKSFGKTDLMLNREKFCQKQSNKFESTIDLSKILQQVIIWEKCSEDRIDSEVIRILNTENHIAQSKTNVVYLKLLEVIKKGRDTGKNILNDINNIIQENKIGRPQIDTDYKSRSEETNLIDFLSTESILLLTGTSQCGKSELAKKISTHFFDKGYDYKITDNVEEIKRFFSTNPSDNKIAILEDPWGHINPISDCEEKKRKIEYIISNAQSHHKLIITCRIEILFDIFETEILDECKINSIQWRDLTIKESSILNEFWYSLSKKRSLPEEITNLVSYNILNSNNKHLLQIGQLSYLANEEISNLTNKSHTEIEHIARRNSKEIARSIKQKDEYFAEVLSVLAMCTTTIYDVNYTDFAYILSKNTDEISIINKDFFSSSYYAKIPAIPNYPEEFHLSDVAEKAIEYLEERRLINVSNRKISFSHPNYYEAGRYLFFLKSESKQKRILNYLKKCISCLSPVNSYLASKQFPFIYNGIKNSLKDEVIKLAFDSLNSIFPSVEDSSLIFLINLIEKIEEKQARRLIRYIQSGGTSSSHIYWHNKKIPFISNTCRLFNNWSVEDKSQIVTEAENELLNRRLPNVYKAWIFIESLKEGKPVQPEIFKILLQYNEAFVRKRVVYQVFNRLDEKNKSILKDIFDDEHPSVVFNAIRASFINWFNFSREQKKILFDLIKKSLNKRQISIRAFNLISTFSIDYSHEGILNWKDFDEEQKKELWNLWSKLYPIIVRNSPLEVFINTARFGDTMNDAMKYLDVNVGIQVLESWLERIDYQIKNDRILNEFEMAIADNLMQLTNDDYNIRKDIFLRLISYNDTSFLLSNLKWIIEYWDKLDVSEKNQIINLIQSDRKDRRWIKAVLLNSYSPPDEICFYVLGEKGLFCKEIDYILSKFSEQLLRDCLNVYCGFPQPLWWLAVHHKNCNFWGKVIRHILLNEKHLGFDICLEEFLSHGVIGFSEDWKDWETLWEQICNQTKEKKLLADSLIYNTANCTCNLTITNKLWSILLESYSVIDNENEIITLIVDDIELLQQTGNREDLLEIFEKKFLIEKIIPELIPDSILINLLKNFKTNLLFNDEEKIKMMSKITEITRRKNIRFFGTFNFIANLIKEENIPNEVEAELRRIPNMIDDIGKEKLEEKNQKYEYKLDNWIGIN